MWRLQPTVTLDGGGGLSGKTGINPKYTGASGAAPDYNSGRSSTGVINTPGNIRPKTTTPVTPPRTTSSGVGYTGGSVGSGTSTGSSPISNYDQQRIDRRAEQDRINKEREAELRREAERLKEAIANVGKGLTKPGAPERATRENLSAELQAIYDELDYYRPDWDALGQSHEQVMGMFGEQRQNIQGEFGLASDKLETNFDRALGAHERGQDYRRHDFGEARRDLGEAAFMQNRNIEAGAASRGLGDSGVKEMAQIQGRMAMGESLNEFARQYYQMEEEAERTISQAREDYEHTTVQLQQSLQSALTEIGSAEVMTVQQYTDKIEGLKRQMEQDKQATAQAKQHFLQTEFETRQALAAFEQAQYETDLQSEYSKLGLGQDMYRTELDTEQARKAYEQQLNQSDDSWQGHRETLNEQIAKRQQDYNLAQQQMAQSAANARRAYDLEKQKLQAAGQQGNENVMLLTDQLIQGYSDNSISIDEGIARLKNVGANADQIRLFTSYAHTFDAGALTDSDSGKSSKNRGANTPFSPNISRLNKNYNPLIS